MLSFQDGNQSFPQSTVLKVNVDVITYKVLKKKKGTKKHSRTISTHPFAQFNTAVL